MKDFKFAHTMIRVVDPEKSVDFYKKALGFTLDRVEKHPEWDYDLYFLSDPSKTAQVELTHNYGHGAYDMGNAYGHIALYTDDLLSAWKELKEEGYNPGDYLRPDGSEKGYFFLTDPDGYEVEIIQSKNPKR